MPGPFKSSNTGETTITNGFSTDDISEIDADIDLTTPLPLSSSSGSGTRNDVSNFYLPFSSFKKKACLHNLYAYSICRINANEIVFVCT